MRGDKGKQEPRKVLDFPFLVDFRSRPSAFFGNTLHANEVHGITSQVKNTG